VAEWYRKGRKVNKGEGGREGKGEEIGK